MPKYSLLLGRIRYRVPRDRQVHCVCLQLRTTRAVTGLEQSSVLHKLRCTIGQFHEAKLLRSENAAPLRKLLGERESNKIMAATH